MVTHPPLPSVVSMQAVTHLTGAKTRPEISNTIKAVQSQALRLVGMVIRRAAVPTGSAGHCPLVVVLGRPGVPRQRATAASGTWTRYSGAVRRA